MAQLIGDHAEQARPELIWNENLALFARYKALDIVNRRYESGHNDPDGYGPNIGVHLTGYEIPYSISVGSNSVESLFRGWMGQQRIPPLAFNEWLNSPGHRAHILGFSAQTNYGIGFATNMNWEWRHAFVFISAPPDNDAVVTPYVAWLFENNTLKQIHDMDFGDGWRYLPWLDTFNDNSFPWLYLYQHKWMYWVGEDVSNIWFYTLDIVLIAS